MSEQPQRARRKAGHPQKPPRAGKIRLKWHGAFVQAIRLELEPYLDSLQFIVEHPLANDPLRIDLLIIRKAGGAVIEKNLAAIFQKENLVEYKSPGAYLSVGDFYKVYGYACIYAAQRKIPLWDLSITLVENRHPEKLLAHLREERGYVVEEVWPGIYHVKGDYLPIQVIEGGRLLAEENRWLRDLRGGLEVEELGRIAADPRLERDDPEIAIYKEVIFRVNAENMEEALRMRSKRKTLEQVVIDVGLAAEWEAQGRVMAKLQVARNLIARGFSREDVAEIAALGLEQVQDLYSAT